MKLRSWAAAIAALVICTSPAATIAAEGTFYGLLRARDLTPFGFLRLDMRPAYAVAIEPGSWALSPEVETYLTNLESQGRRDLGPADVQAIQALPGENYLVDLEQASLDLTLHYKGDYIPDKPNSLGPKLLAIVYVTSPKGYGINFWCDAAQDSCPRPSRDA